MNSTKKPYTIILRNLREDSDYTQEYVARYLGTSQTMYARYERGANELPIRHLIRLSKLYSVTTDYLLGLSKNKSNNHTSATVKTSSHKY